MKVKITCACGESFNINSSNFKDKTSIICQNCSREFPEESFKNFKDAIIKLDEIEKSFSNKTSDNGFPISYWKFEL